MSSSLQFLAVSCLPSVEPSELLCFRSPSRCCLPKSFLLFSCSVVSHSLLTLWIIACQAPLSMGFSRQEHRNGLPCPPPGDLPHPGVEPTSLRSPALTHRFFTTRATWEAHQSFYLSSLLTTIPSNKVIWYPSPHTHTKRILEWFAIYFSRESS